jgi:DNA-directed RNA polymerase subunit alpha
MVSTGQKPELRSRSILLAENLDAEAVLELRHLTHQYRKEYQTLEAALKEAEGVARNAEDRETRRAVACWALDRSEEAAQYAAKAGSSAMAFLVRALVAEGLGQYDEALKHIRKAAELAPSSAPCVLRQVSILRAMGQYEEALSLVEKLRRGFSDKAELMFQEGRCREDLGDDEAALACYRKAVETDGRHAESLFRAAILCDRRGLDKEAKEFYERIGPRAGQTYVNACLNLALMYEDDGDYDNAAACCERVLKLDPNHDRAKLFLTDAEASRTMYYSPEETKQSERLEAVLRVPVSDFELSVRSRNCLQNMNIQTLGDLVKKTESELLSYKNFGETSLREIKEMLSSRGLRLGMFREDAATRAAIERSRQGPSLDVLNKSIAELELGVRSRKCMDSLGIRTIGDLTSKSELELCSMKNFGRVSLNEIKKRLAENGLSLRESA